MAGGRYALRVFASGPGLGPELTWVRGTSNVAIYASTTSTTTKSGGGGVDALAVP